MSVFDKPVAEGPITLGMRLRSRLWACFKAGYFLVLYPHLSADAPFWKYFLDGAWWFCLAVVGYFVIDSIITTVLLREPKWLNETAYDD